MEKSVCTPLNVESISSRRNSFGLGPHFCQRNENILIKTMKRTDHVQSCQLFLEYCARYIFNSDISFTSTFAYTFIKLANSVSKSHQPTRAQSEKTIERLEILLRTIVIKKRARDIPQ